MILLLLLGIGSSLFAAEMWPLEKLYSRPYVWGTAPDQVTWSRDGHTLAFLWNEKGGRFLDLYAYDPDSRRRVRLTDLAGLKDDLLRSADEKEELKQNYLMPEAGLRSFALSRDGAQAAFSFKGDLFLVPTDGSKPPFRLTRTKAGESSPQFSPDARRIASIRGGQVVIQDLGTGQLWQVTDLDAPETLTGYWWSPDGRWITFGVRKQSSRQMPLPNYSGRFVEARSFGRNVAGDEPVAPAYFVASAIEMAKPVALDMGKWAGKAYLSEPVWSPDSSRIAWRSVHSLQKEQQIAVSDPLTGRSGIVAEDKDPAWVYWSEFEWSPDSQWLWFTSERDGFAHVYKVPAAGGKDAVQLTKGRFEARGENFSHQPQWVGDWIYYSSTEDGPSVRHFYRVRAADGSGKEKLSRRAGINDGLVSEDGKHTAWMVADLDNPFDLWVDDHRVTTSPQPGFHELPWPKTRFVTFPSRGDKQLVHAKMLLPPGYDPDERGGKQWPCVFFIHGAGYATSVLKQWGSYQELRFVYNAYLASRGYVVMDLDYRGSTGYGREWRAGVYLHMGGKDLDDVLGAVDYLSSLKNVDMAKLGIWGVSYGGFMTNMAMFLAPDAFKAGSSWAAVNDWENYNAYYTTQRLNTPKQNPEAYRRSSPIYYSSGLKNKLLLIHGLVDSNVLAQDTIQLSEKLIQEGKDFSHFYYPQEDHGFVRDETWVDAARRTTAWFDRYLLDR